MVGLITLDLGLFTIPAREMVDTRTLEALLAVLCEQNIAAMRSGLAPHFDAAPSIRWVPNTDGQLNLAWAPSIMLRGSAACGDLAAWYAASLRATGQDPRATPVVQYRRNRVDLRNLHALVRLGDGRIVDPSAARGMPT